MARKIVGYVELEWICPNCKLKNPGSKKTCSGCGSPQPENVAFQRAQEEKLLDKDNISPAAVHPDIHCGFCGTRNPADAKTCSQCNADLIAGKKRESGQILGGFSPVEIQEIKCPHCASMNPAAYQYCSKCGGSLAQPVHEPIVEGKKAGKFSPIIIILIVLAGILGCVILFSLLGGLFKKDTVAATVDQVAWQRSISIEQFGPIDQDDWKDKIPVEATMGACEKRYHHTQDEPAPDSTEVCGTPYVVDTGSGVGEVAQDCQYEVQLDYCSYSIMDWSEYDQVTLNGSDNNPIWPEISLKSDQREGHREGSYTIHFSQGNNTYSYKTEDDNLFKIATPGSSWILIVNGFNDVITIEPR